MSYSNAARVCGVVVATTTLTVLGAGPAFAHVTAQPGTAEKGGYSVVTLRVPNESDTAGTIALTVTLPADHPIGSVLTTAVPGWTATTTKVALNPPIKDDDGRTVTETTGSVTWKAEPGTKIAPGQFLDFPLSLGPLPDDVDQIALPATQTYDDGEVVNWNESMTPGAAEPEHPAPVVALAAAAAGAGDPMGGAAPPAPPAPPMASPASSDTATRSDTTARWLGGIGLLLGALALGAAAGAIARTRRAAGGGPAAQGATREDANTPS